MLACGRLRVRLALGRCTTRGPAGWQRERARQTLRTPMIGRQVCAKPYDYQYVIAEHRVRDMRVKQFEIIAQEQRATSTHARK